MSTTREVSVYGQIAGAWDFPHVAGKCPSCGSASLFLGVGGHVTCSVIGCADPCAVDDWLAQVKGYVKNLAPIVHPDEIAAVLAALDRIERLATSQEEALEKLKREIRQWLSSKIRAGQELSGGKTGRA